MTNVTQILCQIEDGDPSAAEKLLPLVYEELHKLAAGKMAEEKPGQTLQATALVHEAYLRLVDSTKAQHWNSRGHFFAAAAEAMRRILVETYRRKRARKRGGEQHRVELRIADVAVEQTGENLLALNDAIEQLAKQDAAAAEIATLRIFGGLSLDEAAQAAGLPRTTAYRQWVYAKAWLQATLSE